MTFWLISPFYGHANLPTVISTSVTWIFSDVFAFQKIKNAMVWEAATSPKPQNQTNRSYNHIQGFQSFIVYFTIRHHHPSTLTRHLNLFPKPIEIKDVFCSFQILNSHPKTTILPFVIQSTRKIECGRSCRESES